MSTDPTVIQPTTAQPARSAGDRFRRLKERYGLVHAAAASVGRLSPRFWSVVGPAVTRGYVHKYFTAHSPTYLNLGSGSLIIEGMLNADICPRADSYVDLTSRFPYEDNSFNYIFSEEVIEHFDEATSLKVLKEACRILKPGGIARFTTPRLEWFVDRFLEKDPYGVAFNGIFYNHGHAHIYTERSLRAAMKKAGFDEVRFTEYKDPLSPLGRYDSHADRYGDDPMMSLYVDGTKSPTAA